MRIERRFIRDEQSAYAEIEFRKAVSEIKNPDGSVVFRLADIDVPAQFSQVATDVLAQKYFRKAGVARRLRRVEEESVPSFLWRSVPDEAALAALPEAERYGPETDARQVFDRLSGTWTYWGWKGGYFAVRGGRARFPRRARLYARHPARGAQLAAVVQHRPSLGLWHRRSRPGPFLRRPVHRQADQVQIRLRAPAAACLLHPVGVRRPGQRGRHHGPVGARSAAVQIRLGHRLQFLAAARRRRAAVGRRQIVGADELPEDRRPGCRRHQVGRHHAAGRQDGGGRRRSPRHRGLHRLEGEGGAEGRLAGHRLQDRAPPPHRHHEGLRELRGP